MSSFMVLMRILEYTCMHIYLSRIVTTPISTRQYLVYCKTANILVQEMVADFANFTAHKYYLVIVEVVSFPTVVWE